MPFRQCQAAEIFLVEFQDGCEARQLVEFHAAAAAFPMTDAFRLDVKFCCDLSLRQSQSNPALPDAIGQRNAAIV